MIKASLFFRFLLVGVVCALPLQMKGAVADVRSAWMGLKLTEEEMIPWRIISFEGKCYRCHCGNWHRRYFLDDGFPVSEVYLHSDIDSRLERFYTAFAYDFNNPPEDIFLDRKWTVSATSQLLLLEQYLDDLNGEVSKLTVNVLLKDLKDILLALRDIKGKMLEVSSSFGDLLLTERQVDDFEQIRPDDHKAIIELMGTICDYFQHNTAFLKDLLNQYFSEGVCAPVCEGICAQSITRCYSNRVNVKRGLFFIQLIMGGGISGCTLAMLLTDDRCTRVRLVIVAAVCLVVVGVLSLFERIALVDRAPRVSKQKLKEAFRKLKSFYRDGVLERITLQDHTIVDDLTQLNMGMAQVRADIVEVDQKVTAIQAAGAGQGRRRPLAADHRLSEYDYYTSDSGGLRGLPFHPPHRDSDNGGEGPLVVASLVSDEYSYSEYYSDE